MDEMTVFVMVPKAWFVLDWVVSNGDNQISRIKESVSRLGVEQTDAAALVRRRSRPSAQFSPERMRSYMALRLLLVSGQ